MDLIQFISRVFWPVFFKIFWPIYVLPEYIHFFTTYLIVNKQLSNMNTLCQHIRILIKRRNCFGSFSIIIINCCCRFFYNNRVGKGKKAFCFSLKSNFHHWVDSSVCEIVIQSGWVFCSNHFW